ncbi:MAG: hypothetical protein Q7T12_01875 [Flavobacterium sp.]|nr:hypothetical protein [Flavobacterium sp.]
MNKINYLVFLILLLTLGCKTHEKTIKNISCSGEVILQYDRIKYSDRNKPKAHKNLETFTVYFLSEYKDSIQGYVNEKLIYENYINQRDSDDDNNKYFNYNYSKDTKIPILKIRLVNKLTCFDIQIDKRYKLIYVWLDRNEKWLVRFSNIYYLP